jgi:hypothetical protein
MTDPMPSGDEFIARYYTPELISPEVPPWSPAGRRAVALVIGGALLGVMVATIVGDVVRERAVRVTEQRSYQDGYDAGRVRGSIDAYRELGIGQPGPPGVAGPSPAAGAPGG